MIKFTLTDKGTVSQEFGGSPSTNSTQYSSLGLKGHSGIDTGNGWDTPVRSDNAGYVYKIAYANKSPSNWQAVYILVDDAVEVCYGHLNTVLVQEGDQVSVGQIIGTEGNHGYVFSGGTQITPEMQKAGDHRGHHLHTSYRPVKLVTKVSRGKYYLTTTLGARYKEGTSLFEVINTDNGYNGCVNPRNYLATGDTPEITKQKTIIAILQKVVGLYKQLLNK